MSLFASMRLRRNRLTRTIQSTPSFRPDVQGLRAFAVLAVILAHVTGWPSGGFVGVDVFFVISGFLITGLLLREHDRTGNISFSEFYKRRVKRILPASVLVLVSTTLAAAALLPKSSSNETVVDALWSLFFAGNWRFAASGTDYFNEGTAQSPLQHFWSLAVEEQFYFVWPWLMLAIFWLVAKGRRQRAGRFAVGSAMVVITIASFAWASWETGNNPTVAYFSTLSRAWELGVGALVAVAAPILRRLPASIRPPLAWVGMAGLGVSVLVITPESAFPAPWALLPVLSTALVIIAGTGVDARYLWPLTNRGSRYVGDISYSLYLWHWPVAVLLVAVLESATMQYYLFAIVLTLTLSIASYHFVENPVRYSGRNGRQKPSKDLLRKGYTSASLAVLLLATCLVVAAAVMIDHNRSNLSAAALAPIAISPEAVMAPSEPCRGAAILDPNADCNHSVVPSALMPSIDGMANDQGNGYECWIAEGAEMRTCSHGTNREGALRVALVGDSHAASLVPALSVGAETANWTLDTYVGNGCQWRTIAPENKNCGSPMQEIQAKLTQGEPYDVVLTTASRVKYGSNYSQAVRSSQEAWKPVLERGTKVIVIGDVPEVETAMLECLTRVGFDHKTNDCSTPEGVAFRQSDAMVDAAESLDVPVVDISDLLCFESRCPAVIGGVIVYKDAAAHLTATYAKTMEPYLTQRIRDALGAI